jgi:hypothetical protein
LISFSLIEFSYCLTSKHGVLHEKPLKPKEIAYEIHQIKYYENTTVVHAVPSKIRETK